MQEQQQTPDTDEVNGHPHYELFAGLRHICHDMRLLHVGFQQTELLLEILDSVSDDQPLDAATFWRIDAMRGLLPFRAVDETIERALWSLISAERQIKGTFQGEQKTKIEDRLERLVKEATWLRQDYRWLLAAMKNATEPQLIRKGNLDALWLRFRPIMVQSADLLRTTTPEAVGKETYDRLKKHVSLLRGVMAALERWRDNPSQKMAKGFERCHANWVATYKDLCAMKDEAEEECRRSGLCYMGRFGYKLTTAESHRLQLPPDTPIK